MSDSDGAEVISISESDHEIEDESNEKSDVYDDTSDNESIVGGPVEEDEKTTRSKARIRKALDAVTQTARFESSLLNRSPFNPGLYIDGFGLLPLPFTQQTLDQFTDRFFPDIDDEACIDLTGIARSEIKSQNQNWVTQLEADTQKHLKTLGINQSCKLVRPKILVIRAGQRLALPQGVDASSVVFAKLVVALPSENGIAKLTLEYETSSQQSADSDPYACQQVLFYDSVQCTIQAPVNGPALVLVYDIECPDPSNVPSASQQLDDSRNVRQALDAWQRDRLPEPRYLAYKLSKYYATALSPKRLDSKDLCKWQALRTAVTNDEYFFFLADVEREVTGPNLDENERLEEIWNDDFHATHVSDPEGLRIGSCSTFGEANFIQYDVYRTSRKPDEVHEEEETYCDCYHRGYCHHTRPQNEESDASMKFFDTVILIVPRSEIVKFLISDCAMPLGARAGMVRNLAVPGEKNSSLLLETCKMILEYCYLRHAASVYNYSYVAPTNAKHKDAIDLHAIIEVLVDRSEEETLKLLQTAIGFLCLTDGREVIKAVCKVIKRFGFESVTRCLDQAMQGERMSQLHQIVSMLRPMLKTDANLAEEETSKWIESCLAQRIGGWTMTTPDDLTGLADLVMSNSFDAVVKQTVSIILQRMDIGVTAGFIHQAMLAAKDDAAKEQLIPFQEAVAYKLATAPITPLHGNTLNLIVQDVCVMDPKSAEKALRAAASNPGFKQPEGFAASSVRQLPHLLAHVKSIDAVKESTALRDFICTVLACFFTWDVGQKPNGLNTLARPPIQCNCAFCQEVNAFLKSNTQEVFESQKWKAKDRDHVIKNLDKLTTTSTTFHPPGYGTKQVHIQKIDLAYQQAFQRWELNLLLYRDVLKSLLQELDDEQDLLRSSLDVFQREDHDEIKTIAMEGYKTPKVVSGKKRKIPDLASTPLSENANATMPSNKRAKVEILDLCD